jgi:hypothetical protein
MWIRFGSSPVAVTQQRVIRAKIASTPGKRINWTDEISSSNMRKTIYVIKPLALESACPQRVSFLVREKILPL